MKTFDVTIRYESYQTYTVKAKDEDDAENKAMEIIEREGFDSGDGSIDIDSIEEWS